MIAQFLSKSADVDVNGALQNHGMLAQGRVNQLVAVRHGHFTHIEAKPSLASRFVWNRGNGNIGRRAMGGCPVQSRQELPLPATPSREQWPPTCSDYKWQTERKQSTATSAHSLDFGFSLGYNHAAALG